MIDTQAFEIERIAKSRITEVDFNDLKFGHSFSDHMFVADYNADLGWHNCKITPYAPLVISPAMAAIHYGQSIFEGMKALKNEEGQVLVFRPQANFERINHSAHRMCMPSLPEEVFIGGMQQLLQIDQDWVPTSEGGGSLYIRPFMFATDGYVGIKPSETYKFMIITCPVGDYYTEPIKLRVEQTYTRAAQGGTGEAKCAGNYGGSLLPTKNAQAAGYHQILWTDATHHQYLEECGTMNMMFVIDGVLITPSIDGTILKGVTRSSILDLARSWGMPVQERPISITELIDAIVAGNVQDAFGAGTAAVIAPVITIGYNGIDYQLPPVESRQFGKKVKAEMHAIKTGQIEDTFGWVWKI